MATMVYGENRWRWRMRRERAREQREAMGFGTDPQTGALVWPSGEIVRLRLEGGWDDSAPATPDHDGPVVTIIGPDRPIRVGRIGMAYRSV